MEFYSAMKKNEILSSASKWMELENIILSEVSQAQKTKNRSSSYVDFRSRANTASCWIGSHDKGRAHKGGMGIGSKPKTGKCLMSPLQSN
jgi:hypothetical protein